MTTKQEIRSVTNFSLSLTKSKGPKNTYTSCAPQITWPGLLCSLFLSRMQMKIEFPCPNIEARQKTLLSKASLSDSELNDLVDLCDGFSAHDIQDHIFANAMLAAEQENFDADHFKPVAFDSPPNSLTI